MIEIGLLKVMSNRDNFFRYREVLNPKILSSQSLVILKDYDIYYSQFKEHKDIDFGEFRTLFFIQLHSGFDEKSIEEYKHTIGLIEKYEIQDAINIIRAFEQQEFYNELENHIKSNCQFSDILNKIESFKDRLQAFDSKEEIKMDIIKALEETQRGEGLQWNLDCLREHFGGGIIKGDLIEVAGYVGVGKTGFLIHEVSYMAKQLKDNEYVLWLNSEGSWNRVLKRIYCSVLDTTDKSLTEWKEQARLKYIKEMKGNENRIMIRDIGSITTTKQIEQWVKKQPPALLVIDLIDHVKGYEQYMKGDGGNFERYSKLYQWALDTANQYCPVIVSTQLNGDGFDSLYPKMNAMRGSRVDKQAAATAIILIGKKENEDNLRYLSTPKFKINGHESWKATVNFDPLRCKFEG